MSNGPSVSFIRIRIFLEKIQEKLLEIVGPKAVDVVYEASAIVLPEPARHAEDDFKIKDVVCPMVEGKINKVAESMYEYFDAHFAMDIRERKLKEIKLLSRYMQLCKRTGGILVSVYHSEQSLPQIQDIKRAKAWTRGSMYDNINTGLARMTVWYIKKSLKKYSQDLFMKNGKLKIPEPNVVFNEVAKHIIKNGNSDAIDVIAQRKLDLSKIMSKLEHSLLLANF